MSTTNLAPTGEAGTLRRNPPDGYPVLSYCTSCGRDFSGDTMFDRHRVGVHDYTFAEGLRMDPPKEDGRRCLDPEEMLARGWRPFTDEEMAASSRDRRRVGYDVELWHDPARQARGRDGIAARGTEAS